MPMARVEKSYARNLLRQSAEFRFFALCFQQPRPSLHDDLVSLGIEIGGAAEALAERAANCEREYHYVLGTAGVCSPCESSYVGDRLGGKGPLMADVAGFYRAFAFEHDREAGERVDHIAVELSFLSYMKFKEAYARYRGDDPEATLCEEAIAKFEAEHLGCWLEPLREKLTRKAPESFCRAAAEGLSERVSSCCNDPA